MREVVINVSETLNETMLWCRTYPAHIGRKFDECIGVFSFTVSRR